MVPVAIILLVIVALGARIAWVSSGTDDFTRSLRAERRRLHGLGKAARWRS